MHSKKALFPLIFIVLLGPINCLPSALFKQSYVIYYQGKSIHNKSIKVNPASQTANYCAKHY